MTAFGGQGGPRPKAHVLVTDLDESVASRFLVGSLRQDAVGEWVEAETVSYDEGRARIEKGDASAHLVIPAGFQQALLREQPSTLLLTTNPQQRILPGIVEEFLSILVDATFYAHRLAGSDIRGLLDDSGSENSRFSDLEIASFSVRINQLAERLTRTLDPLVLRLEIETETEPEEPTPLGALFFPSLLYMTLLFMSQGLSADLWQEREQRTLRRILVSPEGIVSFLLGKLLSGAGLLLVVGTLAAAIGFGSLALEVQTLPLAILWSTLSGVLFLVLMMGVQLYAPNARAGNVLTTALVFPLMMAGGSFFPFESMPGWMAAIGEWTPNGWSLVRWKSIVFDHTGPITMAPALFVLLTTILVLFWLCARRLRTQFARG